MVCLTLDRSGYSCSENILKMDVTFKGNNHSLISLSVSVWVSQLAKKHGVIKGIVAGIDVTKPNVSVK